MSSRSAELVNAGVRAAFEREGLLQEDGGLDNAGMRARITEEIVKAKVLTKSEKESKAITKGDLVAKIFPSLTGPENFDDTGDALLASDIYREVEKKVWAATAPAYNGPVQRGISLAMGNGYVLCRTEITKNRVPAVYVTDSVTLIQADFTRPDNERTIKALERAAKNREMLILRQPDNGKRYMNEYDSTFKAELARGHSQLVNALEAAGPSVDEDDDDE